MSDHIIAYKGVNYAVRVSDEDDYLFEEHRYYLNNSGDGRLYVARSCSKGTRNKRYLHHDIMPKVPGMDIDHRDRNRLNNRRDNLRYATRSQNMGNVDPASEYSNSGFRGVYLYTNGRTKPWFASIVWLGTRFCAYFYTRTEAVAWRTEQANRLFGAFAPQQRKAA